jgi:CMP-N,N'-diacetyllegionaminic acid synthase
MIRGERLTAIIPARGGSKGIPRKNMLRIGGETIVERSIRLARESGWVDRILVTTDDPEIYELAKRHDAAPPNLRPPHLATDLATTIDAVNHLIVDASIEDGYVLLLQPTSPLRTAADLDALCKAFEAHPDAQAIVSVVRHESPHPNKIIVIDDGYVRSYLGTNPNVPRQSLPVVHSINGAFYIVPVRILVVQQTFLPERTMPFEMPVERSVNLDTPLDLLLMEVLLKQAEPSQNHG